MSAFISSVINVPHWLVVMYCVDLILYYITISWLKCSRFYLLLTTIKANSLAPIRSPVFANLYETWFANFTLDDLYDFETCVCQCYIGGFLWYMYMCLPVLHWKICIVPVFVNVTLEDLYSTCVCQCYIGGFVWYLCWQCYIGGFVCVLCLPMLHWRICMRPVFANFTLDDLYETCIWQCNIGWLVWLWDLCLPLLHWKFVWHLCLPMLHWMICMRPVYGNVTLDD